MPENPSAPHEGRGGSVVSRGLDERVNLENFER